MSYSPSAARTRAGASSSARAAASTTTWPTINRELAAAHAADRGWARENLEAAARAAYAGRRDGAEPSELTLLQIVDRPGTDEDKAVFQVAADGRAERLTLGRSGDEWVFERLD